MVEPGKSILLVDDDPFILDVLGRQLKAKGLRVLATTDPENAFAMAKEQRPALIISDIAMPAVDGFTLLKELRQDPATSSTPLILLTGSDKLSDVEQGFTSGAQAYLIKPIDWDSAWPKIQSYLG